MVETNRKQPVVEKNKGSNPSVIVQSAKMNMTQPL